MQDFRKLLVWQRAHAFALEIRRVTAAFPKGEYSDLKRQIRSAAESIVNNIVEGCGAASPKEFARYLDISIKSACEVDYELEFARDVEVLRHDVWEPLSGEVVEIRKMTFGLRREVLGAERRRKDRRAVSATMEESKDSKLETDD